MLRSGSIPPASCAWGRCFRDCSCLSTRSLHLSRLRGRSAGALCAAAGRGSFGASPLRGPLPTPPPQAGEGCACGCACELAPMTALAALLLRDMRLAVRVGGGALMGVLFFLLVVTMVPFGVGPDLKLLARIGPAILWIGALLATLLGLDRLLAADHDDGSLDLILMGHAPLELAVAAKALAHWLTTGLPLVIAAPLFGIFLNFGIAAGDAAILNAAPFGAPFLILIALTLTSVVIGPVAAAAVLRHGLD